MLQQRFWGSINFAPRAEADSDCAIMLRNGWVEVPCDYGAEQNGWDHCTIMVRNEIRWGEPCDYGSERIWCSWVILWCGTEAFLGGDIMVRNGVGLRVFHGIFCVKFTVLQCFFNILTLFPLKTVLSPSAMATS